MRARRRTEPARLRRVAGRSPELIAAAAQCACLLEVMAQKPGNVSRGRDLPGLTYRDFILSAMALGRTFRFARRRRVGRLILDAVRETRRLVRTNTNLGMVILMAPLARAAAMPGHTPLRARLRRVLQELDLRDARDTYEAIRIAEAGGLGRVDQQDVRQPPTATLLECMRLASARDAVAREYVDDYRVTFETALPLLLRAREAHLPLPIAVAETSLQLLARIPDTLIARKHGGAAARRVSRGAASILAAGGQATAAGRRRLARFDRRLRTARPPLNPGATADIVAVALFVWILESGMPPDDPVRRPQSPRRSCVRARR